MQASHLLVVVVFWCPEFGGNNQKQMGITYSSFFTVGLLFVCCFVALKRVENCTLCIVIRFKLVRLWIFAGGGGGGGGGGGPKQERLLAF